MSQAITPSTDHDRRQKLAGRVLLGASVLFGLLAWLGVWFQMTFFAPRTESLMLGFKMRLPVMTELLLRQSWWMLPAVAILALVFCLGIRKRWAWSFALVVLPLLLNVFVLVSLYLATTELAIGLQAAMLANR